VSAAQPALPDRLRSHVRALAGTIGPRHVGRPGSLGDAAGYIERALAGLGLAPRRQEFSAGGDAVCNVEAAVGTAARGPIVVLGAHYDTVPGSPGADDNASGVAAALEIARLLGTERPAAEVRCVFFVNEEPPWFQSDDMGSVHYARRLRAQGIEVAGMLSLESIGYYDRAPQSQRYPFPLGAAFPHTGDFVGIVSDRKRRGLLRRVVRSFEQHSDFPVVGAAIPAWVPGVSWSDQWAFWQQGYPAVMVTDTAPFRNPHYHTADDTPERLDYAALARVTSALAAVALDLAAAPRRLPR
jgi:Zn-dependent M28 family amino/carboxypeptidase